MTDNIISIYILLITTVYAITRDGHKIEGQAASTDGPTNVLWFGVLPPPIAVWHPGPSNGTSMKESPPPYEGVYSAVEQLILSVSSL